MYPRLVILSRGPRLYSTRRLAEEAQKAGWAVRIIDPLSLTVVVDEKGGLKVPEYTSSDDLVHPNKNGYDVMKRIIQISLKKDLK